MKQKCFISIFTKISEEESKLIHSLGYVIVSFCSNVSMAEFKYIDYPILTTEESIDIVRKKIDQINDKFIISRIFTLREYFLELVLELQREYCENEYFIGAHAIRSCRNKKVQKHILRKKNIPTAAYIIIKNAKDIEQMQNQKIKYPVVVKPSNESGSRFVKICYNYAQIVCAIDNIKGTKQNRSGISIDSDILIEEYIDGPEYSVESYTINGETKVVAITAKETLECIEVCHTVPAPIDEKRFAEMATITEQALSALDMKYGVAHTELKYSSQGVKIIEVNARIAGDNISSLVQATTGIDLKYIAINLCLDGTINSFVSKKCSAKSASIRYITADSDGILNYNDSVLREKYTFNIQYRSGERVNKTTDNTNRIGYFMIYSETNNAYDLMLDTYKKLNVKIIKDGV